MEKQEKDGMTYWHVVGGFTIVRTPKGRIYQYSEMFYGNWKVYPPEGGESVKQFKTEEEVIEYLLEK